MNKDKKAVVGIGTLIVFIAAILVSSIAATVIIVTQGHLQSEALEVGRQAKEAVALNIGVESIKGYDCEPPYVSKFMMSVKLGPGSDPIRFNATALSILTSNSSTMLKYGGTHLTNMFSTKPSRKIDWDITTAGSRLKSDLDVDYIEDRIRVYNSTTLVVNLSRDPDVFITVPDISLPGTEFNSSTFAIVGRRIYGNLTIDGNTTIPNRLDSGMDITLKSKEHGQGLYAIKYSMKGSKYKEGNFNHGDFIKIYFENSQAIEEDKDITINLHAPMGVPITKNVKTPDVITTSSITLFP